MYLASGNVVHVMQRLIDFNLETLDVFKVSACTNAFSFSYKAVFFTFIIRLHIRHDAVVLSWNYTDMG